LDHISYLQIKEKIFSGEDIMLNGDLIINDAEDPEKIIKLNTAFLLQYQDGKLIVKKIKIENQETINEVLKEIIDQKESSL